MGILGFLSSKKSIAANGVGRNGLGSRSQGHSRGPYSISNPLPERTDEVHARRQSWGIRLGNSETAATETLANSSTPRHLSPLDTSLRSADAPIPKNATSKGHYVPLKKPRLIGSKHASQDASVSRSGVKTSIASSRSDHQPPASPTLSRQSTKRHDSIQSARGFVDILDAQDEIRPSDFRSRVRAAGARDYGEDVAERNIGQNGTDLTSPSVLEFYTKNGSATQGGTVVDNDGLKMLGSRGDFSLRRTRQTGSRGSRSFASIASIASIAESTVTDPDETSSSSRPSHDEIRRRSATAALSTTGSLSMTSNRASRGRRSRPPSMIRTDLAPFSATSNMAFVPPAIPTYTPPVSPCSLRDSIILAKEKQASSPLAKMHSYRTTQQKPSAFSVGEESEEAEESATPPHIKRASRIISISAFDPHNSPPQDEPRGRTLTRKWVAGVNAPYSPVPSPAYSHPEEFDDAALPPSVHRHWSFSSTTPTTASTCVSTPYSMYRPHSRHTASTSVDDDIETVSPSCRTSGSSLVLNQDGGSPLFCTAMEARVMIPNIVSPLGQEVPPCASGEFTLDDYLSSDEVDSLRSFGGCPNKDAQNAAVNTPRTGFREEDADFLFRDTGYGGDGSQQLPGLFDNIQETGMETAMPHPNQSGRPSSLMTLSATDSYLFDGNRQRGTIASVFEWSDAEDEDGEDSQDESFVAHLPMRAGELRKSSSPSGVKKSGGNAKPDVRAALRLRKQAKTLARLTGKPPARRCAADSDDSDDARNEEHDDVDAAGDSDLSFF